MPTNSGNASRYFCAEVLARLVAIDAEHRAPAEAFGRRSAEFEEFRLRRTVLQIDERARHRVGDELLAERGVFGRDPVVDHDRPGIDFLELLDHRAPVVDRILDVGHLGEFEIVSSGWTPGPP